MSTYSHKTTDEFMSADDATLDQELLEQAGSALHHSDHAHTHKLAITALMCAASLLLSFIQIPIFPAAPWLMYDPSGVICLFAGLVLGPQTGVLVAVLSWLPRIFFDPFGTPMGILSTCAFLLPATILYAKTQSRTSCTKGLVLGAVLSIIVACALNLVITPFYAHIPMEQVAAMIIPILLPFNALKMLVNISLAQLAFKPVMHVFDQLMH